MSALEVTLVPPGLMTITCTGPAPAEDPGETAVIEVFVFTVKLVAFPGPKSTSVALVNPRPVMFTVVPPEAGPALGLTLVTLGAAT